MAKGSQIAVALLGCGLAFVMLPARAAAQCQLCAPSAQATTIKPLQPITIAIETTIDFARIGLISMNQGGTARIDPITGQRTLTGSLLDLGGMPVVGTVLVRGEPNTMLNVSLPTSVQLFNSSGSGYPLSNFTTTLKNNPKLGVDGTLRFTFGAVLQISGSATGVFRGSIPITVDYK
jgi:hypothetical protein